MCVSAPARHFWHDSVHDNEKETDLQHFWHDQWQSALHHRSYLALRAQLSRVSENRNRLILARN